MIAPTIPEQLDALRTAAQAARSTPNLESLRRAEVLDYIRNRIEVYANKALLNRAEQP
jgi:hypothetical protein